MAVVPQAITDLLNNVQADADAEALVTGTLTADQAVVTTAQAAVTTAQTVVVGDTTALNTAQTLTATDLAALQTLLTKTYGAPAASAALGMLHAARVSAVARAAKTGAKPKISWPTVLSAIIAFLTALEPLLGA
jgi:hypothetical protein